MAAPRVDIQDLNKADVLAGLYNNARSQGMGIQQYDPSPMSRDEARAILESRGAAYFDYLKGRVMKVDLAGDSFDPWGYDRDNGPGKAQRVVTSIRESAAEEAQAGSSRSDGVTDSEASQMRQPTTRHATRQGSLPHLRSLTDFSVDVEADLQICVGSSLAIPMNDKWSPM